LESRDQPKGDLSCASDWLSDRPSWWPAARPSPPAVTVATWAVDGATLALSGKSVSDHAISALTGKDCAMWRLLKGEPVCADYPAEDAPAQAAVPVPPAPPPPAKLDRASAPPLRMAARDAGRGAP